MRSKHFLLLLFLFFFSSTLPFPLSSDPCDPNALPDPLTLRPDQLTVLISGYSESRLPLLLSLATSYSSLPSVASVIILWFNPTTPSHLLPSPPLHGGNAPISLLRHSSSSLNSRFLPRPSILTRAVAICDDDVEIDPRSLAFAFSVWKSREHSLVGFFARSHDLDLERKTWIYTVHPNKYSIVLSKLMILKTDYLFRYTCGNTLSEARRLVDRVRNCEDILMNFVVAMEGGVGPVLVEGRGVRDWGDPRNNGTNEGGTTNATVALSARGDHRKKRGDCIREFHRVLGKMPLRYSYGKVVEGVGEQGLCQKGRKLVFCDQQ